MLLAIVGAVLGLGIGLASFLALTVPYVLGLNKFEKYPRIWKLWGYLFLPVMVVAVVLAIRFPWYIVGLLQ